MQQVYHKAMPTDSDIRRMIETYKGVSVNDFISHEELEELIRHPRSSHRYRTLVTKWKSLMARDHNVELKAEVGKGYRVLDSIGRVDLSVSGLRSAKKRVTRSLLTISRTDISALEEPDANRANHARLLLSSTLHHMNEGIKELPKLEVSKPIHIDNRPKA